MITAKTENVYSPFHIRKEIPDLDSCRDLSQKLNLPLAIAVLLRQRGIKTDEEAAKFLNPQLAELPSPFLMKGMQEAVNLTIRANREQWPVYIHGDYDVDGISGTALLAQFLRTINTEPICYQPDRLTEGYGVQGSFIRQHAPSSGNALLITVDCGISSNEEVKLARDYGYHVIVTDHHETPATLPEANVILNPKQKGCNFPDKELAGVGVAFFLAMGVRNTMVSQGTIHKNEAPNLKQLLDLVALGTVADVMPLTGINRILVKAGLEVMNKRQSPWSWALSERANIYGERMKSEDISFRISPRINAPGRLGKPELSFELLACNDTVRALELVELLEKSNQERRQLEHDQLDSVLNECMQQQEAGCRGFVVHGKFHPGVIGILASRVVDRFHKPIFILTEDAAGSNVLKGSGRSVEGINLYEVLQECAELVVQFGGHSMAAGMTLIKDKLFEFKEKFNISIPETAHKANLVTPDMVFDYCISDGGDVGESFLHHYRYFEPFGNGNPEPVFLIQNVRLQSVQTIKNHLKYSFTMNNRVYKGIGFDMADKRELARSGNVQLAFKLKNYMFKGKERTEVHTVCITSTP